MQLLTKLLGFGQKRSNQDVRDPAAVPAGAVGYSQPIRATTIGAVEACAALYARAFAAADQMPRRISPSNMALLGRELVRRGELLFAISGGEIIPAIGWSITGDARPSSWLYHINTYGPSDSHTFPYLTPDQVLHFRMGVDPETPYCGRSAIQLASELSTLATRTERSLGDEAGGAVGRLINYNGDPDVSVSLAAEFNKTRGAMRAISNTPDDPDKPGMGTTIARFGPTPPSELVNLQKTNADAVMQVCGVPPSLMSNSGTGMREGWRVFLLGLTGLAATLSEEIEAKLGPCEISFRTPNPIDVRARAFAAMVNAGMHIDAAAELCGLESELPLAAAAPEAPAEPVDARAKAYKHLLESGMSDAEARAKTGLE